MNLFVGVLARECQELWVELRGGTVAPQILLSPAGYSASSLCRRKTWWHPSAWEGSKSLWCLWAEPAGSREKGQVPAGAICCRLCMASRSLACMENQAVSSSCCSGRAERRVWVSSRQRAGLKAVLGWNCWGCSKQILESPPPSIPSISWDPEAL